MRRVNFLQPLLLSASCSLSGRDFLFDIVESNAPLPLQSSERLQLRPHYCRNYTSKKGLTIARVTREDQNRQSSLIKREENT